jgi:hypothetical protein
MGGWLGWLLVSVALVTLFVIWDLVLCGGKYCKWLGGDRSK